MYRRGHLSVHDAVMEFRGKFKDTDRARAHNPTYVYARPLVQDNGHIKKLNQVNQIINNNTITRPEFKQYYN